MQLRIILAMPMDITFLMNTVESNYPLRTTPTTPTAATTGTTRNISIIIATRLPPRPNSNRYPLNHAAMVMSSRIHAVVDGEVAADQVRTHSGVLAGQSLRRADRVRLIFSIIDTDDAAVAFWSGAGFVRWILPAATAAEAYQLVSLSLARSLDVLHCMELG